MKNKLTILLSLILVVICCFSFTACNDDKTENPETFNGQVSDEKWQEVLGIDFNTVETVTYLMNMSTQTDETTTLKTKTTFKIDLTKEIIYMIIDIEHYENDVINEELSSSSECYYLKNDSEYYILSYIESLGWNALKIDEVGFNGQLESCSNAIKALNGYSDPAMKDNFTFNEETKTYEMNQTAGTGYSSLKFLENGITLYVKLSSTIDYEMTVTDYNKTSITIPNEALEALA